MRGPLSDFFITPRENDSPLLRFEIIEVFVNTLTADDNYPVAGCENLQFPIQIK